MKEVAKLFTVGGSQAVRLPAAYRFDAADFMGAVERSQVGQDRDPFDL